MDSNTKHDIDKHALALVERRAELEFDLLHLVLADPAALWPTAAAEGITPAHFEQDDARAIARALEAEHSSRDLAQKEAVQALMDVGLYADWIHADETRLAQWSIPRMVRWSRKFYADPPPDLRDLVASTAAALIEISERIEKAESLAKEYFALVGEGVAR